MDGYEAACKCRDTGGEAQLGYRTAEWRHGAFRWKNIGPREDINVAALCCPRWTLVPKPAETPKTVEERLDRIERTIFPLFKDPYFEEQRRADMAAVFEKAKYTGPEQKGD